jgi:dihydroorotate dehydrogenase (fumarate)
MADLSTTCMGLSLKNPIVVASCGLTRTVEGVRRCADAGAGAVVLKSLFEEQIDAEIAGMERAMGAPWHAEAVEYMERMGKQLGPRDYLDMLEHAKRKVTVPVIASLNCTRPRQWVDYATRLVGAGADALELNIALMPSEVRHTGSAIEDTYLEIVEAVKARVAIPIAVKLGPYFTSLARFADTLAAHGVSALVLFNRFYRFDIDPDHLRLTSGQRLSTPDELSLPLRWIALLSGKIRCDLIASTGIHGGAGVVKQLLAGASAVQVCSTLYRNGLEQIGAMVGEIETWMKNHGFDSIGQFRGKLAQMRSEDPESYERLQYVKALVGIE